MVFTAWSCCLPLRVVTQLGPRKEAWFIPTRQDYLIILQNSRASLVAQMVKNPPTMQETQVQPLGQEEPLEKGMATQFSIHT